MKDIMNAPFLVEMVRTTTNMYNHGWDERTLTKTESGPAFRAHFEKRGRFACRGCRNRKI